MPTESQLYQATNVMDLDEADLKDSWDYASSLEPGTLEPFYLTQQRVTQEERS